MRRNSELLTTLAGVLGAVISLLAVLLTSLEIKGLSDNNTVYLIAVLSAGFTGIFSVYVLRMKEKLLKKKRVFVIYSHKDYEAAVQLVKKLRDAGFDPWFDRDEIVPGQRIEESLIDGMMQSAAAILLVSKNMETPSKFLSFEIELALSSMRSKNEQYSPIIPVRLDEHPVPDELKGISWIQLSQETDFEQLARGLRNALDG